MFSDKRVTCLGYLAVCNEATEGEEIDINHVIKPSITLGFYIVAKLNYSGINIDPLSPYL